MLRCCLLLVACCLFAVPVWADEGDCSDGVDNDYDGRVDCRDDDCPLFFDSACCSLAVSTEDGGTCWDGLDNDCDGVADCEDPDCVGQQFLDFNFPGVTLGCFGLNQRLIVGQSSHPGTTVRGCHVPSR